MRADLRTSLTADPPPTTLNLVYLLAARSEQDDHWRRCRACEILLAPIELSGHVAFVGPSRSIVSPTVLFSLPPFLRIEFFQVERRRTFVFSLPVTITCKRESERERKREKSRLETIDYIITFLCVGRFRLDRV